MSITVKILYPNKEDLISFQLADLNVRIGRSQKAEVTLQDNMCSGLHMPATSGRLCPGVRSAPRGRTNPGGHSRRCGGSTGP